jgi:hypothetical protein
VNQLARREPGEVRALLGSGEELRKAQQRALRGKGAAELQKRVDEQRRAVRALARLGRDILAHEGRSVSDAIVDRIGKTLDAAALNEGSRALLAAMAPAATPPKRPAPEKRKSGAVAEARKRVTAAKRELRARDRDAARAEREAERAEQASAEARRAADDARGQAEDARRALADAEAALRGAERQ